jgi:hypothetical protein
MLRDVPRQCLYLNLWTVSHLTQGKLEMWVDIFPAGELPLPLPVDISPPQPQEYELRVIIWNTMDVVLQEYSHMSKEMMTDIYVKG